MARPKFEQLAWPERSTSDVVQDDDSGEATASLLAELEAGRLVALGNLGRPLDAAALRKYEEVADAFRRAQSIVVKLWQEAHPRPQVPSGLLPFVHRPDAIGVSTQRS